MLKHEDNAVGRINGNNLQPLAGVSVTVTDKTTGLPASLYADDGTTPLAQPLITDNNGYYGFKAPDGTYVLTFSGARIETFTREIVLDDPLDNPYVTVAGLAAGTGAAGVGNGGETVADSLDALQLADYAALRAYAGPRKSVYITGYLVAAAPSGIAGMFVRDDSDTTTSDNAGTVIVSSNGKRWKRQFSGSANVLWFGAKGGGVAGGIVDSAAFVAALAAHDDVCVPAGEFVASFDMRTGQRLSGAGTNLLTRANTVLIAPAGAAHVIRLDASAANLRYCTIRDLQIYNQKAVANCVGIKFYGLTVANENDYHTVENVVVRDFDTNIQVRGRLIYGNFRNVRLRGEGITTVNLDVSTDPADVAFNVNDFLACSFMGAKYEGVKLVGQNVGNSFRTCTIEGNNTSKTPGKAGMRLENTRNILVDTCYFENNGPGMTVDATTLSNNGIDLHFTCGVADGVHYNPTVRNTWFKGGSGINVWVGYDDSTGGTPNAFIRGGEISNNIMQPATGGYSFYCSAARQTQSIPPVTLDGSNSLLGTVTILKDGNNQQAAAIRQINTNLQFFMSSSQNTVSGINSVVAATPDGAGTDLNINFIVAGQQFTFHNPSALGLVINPSYFWSENGVTANNTIPPRCARTYVAEGTYNSGGGIKLYEVSNAVKAAATPIRATFNRGDRIQNTLPSASGFSVWITTTGGGAPETTRANSTAYAAGVWAAIGATVCECITAGTSGASAPTTPTTVGQVFTDGTVSWKCRSLTTAVFKTDALSA